MMTREGFTILAMGFTGAKAVEFKIKYIQAFNAMEAELRQRSSIPALPDFANPAKAARAWAEQFEGRHNAEQLVRSLQTENKELQKDSRTPGLITKSEGSLYHRCRKSDADGI